MFEWIFILYTLYLFCAASVFKMSLDYLIKELIEKYQEKL